MNRREAGFTLIEIVVAFVLLGLVLSTGFEIFSEGMTRATGLAERSKALEIASSRLADLGAEGPVKPGISQGEARDARFHWTSTIDPYTEGQDPAHPVTSAYALYRVEVKVDWHGADGKDRSLSLATLRLGSHQ